jgi:peptidoglycan/LPS O-acetylase OafA/YrhL
VKKYDYIDSVRGYAILGVILIHTMQKVPLPYGLNSVTEAGQFGVQLFFIASALTLCMSAARRRPAEEHKFLNFIIRRYFRIAPMYYTGILLYFIVRSLDQGQVPPVGYDTGQILSNATFTHGWAERTINFVVPGGWSIAVEFTFYLAFPLLFLLASSLRRSLVLLGVFLVVSLGLNHFLFGLGTIENHSFQYFWIVTQLPVFGLGFVLYRIIVHPEISAFMEANPKLNHVLWAGVLGFCFAGYSLMDRLIVISPYCFGLGFVLFILSLCFHSRPWLVNPFMVWTGRLSYSLYITHFTFAWYLVPALSRRLDLMNHPSLNAPMSLLLVLVFSMAVSFVTYNVIEKTGINLGKRLIRRLEKA